MLPVPRRDWQVVATLAVLSVVVRLPGIFARAFDLVSFDGTYYINQARVLWSSVPMPGAFPVGYPFFISLVLPVVGDGVRAAQVVSLLASFASLLVMYALARRFLDRRLAFYCTVFLAVTPLFVRLSMETFSESIYTLWLLLALWMYAKGRDAASGAAAGVAVITRPEMLGVAGILALLRIRTPRRAVLFVLPFIVIFSFNTLKLYQSTGNFVALPKGDAFGSGAQSWTEREATVEPRPSGVAVVDEAAGMRSVPRSDNSGAGPSASDIAVNYAKKLPHEVLLLARNVGFLALLLAFYGFARRPSWLLAALAPFVIAPLFTIRSIDRFLLPYIPVVLLYAFIGAGALKGGWARRGGYAALIVSAIAAVAFNYGQFVRPVNEDLVEMKEAGIYLRDNAVLGPGDVVADRKPYVAFYAGARYLEIPFDSYQGTMQYLLDENVRYLSLHTRILKSLRPLMLTLVLDRAVILGELRFEQIWGHKEGLLLYRKVLDRDPLTWRLLHDPGAGLDSSPAWSPGGGFVAFSSRVGNQLDIFVIPVEGGEARAIVTSPHQDDQPSWSPHGERIAFCSNRDGNWNIYILDLESGDAHAVTTHEARDVAPTWMRDGRALVFMSERSGEQELWKIDLAGGELTQLTTAGTNNFPAVSPRGDMVAWTSVKRGLNMMQLSTGNMIQVRSPAEANYFPSWSPDSRYLAVTGRDWGSVDIYLVSADGNRSLLLTKNAVPGDDVMIDALPSWSPDGNSLALISNKDGTQALWVVEGLDVYKKRLDTRTPIITFELEDD